MTTLEYIYKRYNIDPNQKSPIELHFSRHKEFANLLYRLGFRTGAEIGVDRGRYSKILCQYNPKLKLYCIDPWVAYEGYYENHTRGRKIYESYGVAKERLKNYNCELIQKFSMDAVKDFEDNSLDFCFIDGNHSFEYAVNDIVEWSKKVRVGGIISGHDFWNSPVEEKKLCQVKEAVLGWTRANRIEPFFILTGDKCPSWMWVKTEVGCA